MPDILIRGMEMPGSCELCNFRETVGRDEWMCEISRNEFPTWEAGWNGEDYRHTSCPLIELPPHGDLIDRDALLSRGKNNPFVDSEIYHPCVQTNCREIVMDEPVVVPAEREGKA